MDGSYPARFLSEPSVDGNFPEFAVWRVCEPIVDVCVPRLYFDIIGIIDGPTRGLSIMHVGPVNNAK